MDAFDPVSDCGHFVVDPVNFMTKWQHFLHILGQHDWHKVREFDKKVARKPCGPHDPRPKTETISMVDVVCCQCGEKRQVSYQAWIWM
jgi:hypothetical protein